MPSPLLVLTFCAFLPASPEADMSPVLAPAILVEDDSASLDGVATVELSELIDPAPIKPSAPSDAPYLGSAVVVESN